MRNALLFLFVAAVPFACSTPATTDGGNDAGDTVTTGPDIVDAMADVRADAGPPFEPCTMNAECPAPGALCITEAMGYPGGLCTRRCTSDSQCGAGGTCAAYGAERRCLPTCASGTDCRDGYNCFSLTSQAGVHVCLPLCNADTQCGAVGCDEYTGFCGTPDTTLSANGGQCLADTDCSSGRCLEEIDPAAGTPTGNLDGLCYSSCTIPDDAQYATNVPNGGCPNSGVCVRGTSALAGDIGICRPECTTEADCRGGYICVHPRRIGGTGTTTNGYCAAMNCHYMTQTCPPNATCQTTTTNDAGVATFGVCARTDGGGTDASTDASDVATDTTPAVDATDVATPVDGSDVIDDALDAAIE